MWHGHYLAQDVAASQYITFILINAGKSLDYWKFSVGLACIKHSQHMILVLKLLYSFTWPTKCLEECCKRRGALYFQSHSLLFLYTIFQSHYHSAMGYHLFSHDDYQMKWCASPNQCLKAKVEGNLFQFTHALSLIRGTKKEASVITCDENRDDYSEHIFLQKKVWEWQ